MGAMANPTEALCLAVMVLVLGFAVIRPRGLPEAVAAVPGALLLLAAGAISLHTAGEEAASLGPTVAFLAAVLVLSDLCEREGLFHAAGQLMARGARGEPVRLLRLVFVAAAVTTAVLSLDATVVLLTPVVFATASRVGVRPRPHVYATAHLANSASLLLPVSNLTNLLALQASGLGFGMFAAVMFLPWAVSLAIEYLVFRRHFASDLSVHEQGGRGDEEEVAVPRFAVAVLVLVLVGFVACSALGVETFWAALAGVVLLGGKRLVEASGAQRGEEAVALARSVNLWFVAFVLALGMVVRAVVDNGLSEAMGHLVPHGAGLGSLLALALTAALLANLVNNLPAVLVLLPLVAPAGPVAVLAVLIGVNIGPNLTYVGSLATLLWRRIVADHDHDTEVAEFTKLGVATVPASLVLCTIALWGAARVMGV
ncbi:SLC13 family permease [Luteococcus peritonei]|uniref:SLC13 family permease n=1 Tax=Luteococcus peritonei TaxID=88874 RepID=A0ABW4RTH7_9ACTN